MSLATKVSAHDASGYPYYWDGSAYVRAVPINRLAGITATFDTFDTDPSTPLNMTDGDWATETGEGVKSLAGVNGVVGNIKFSMNTSYPVIVIGHTNAHRDSGDGTIYARVDYSTDGITYHSGVGSSSQGAMATDVYKAFLPVFLYARYFRILFATSTVTVNPSVFHVKVAEVQALQLL